MSQTLYRKYRPRTFSEVVGQEHVVRTLQGSLATGRIGHAFLFTGPRGTGKTTLARVFSRALNCDSRHKDGNPCDGCDFCKAVNAGNSLDVIEIDAASNRGIEEIRNLKESALVAAPGGKFKVFIIDEVHMLTKDAFNALLKILEEPPAHVVFMLATTEPNKILPTVLSRVQRFDFKRLTPAQIFEKLKTISGAEKLNVEDGALKLIASSADGALRDAEVSLAKVRSVAGTGKITAEIITESLGLIPANYHPEFFGYLVSNNKVAALDLIQRMHDSGIDLENFAKDFLEYSRQVLMAKINPAVLASISGMNDEETKNISALGQTLDNQRLIKMIVSFSNARNEIKYSPIPQLPLELAVIDVCGHE